MCQNSYKTFGSDCEIEPLTVRPNVLKGGWAHSHSSGASNEDHRALACDDASVGVRFDPIPGNPHRSSRRVPLDLETGDADDLYRAEPDDGYIRLVGVDDTVHGAPRDVVAPGVSYVTHNGHYFDFPALHRHAGIPVEQTIPASRDLRVAAFQHDPPTTYQTSRGPGFKSYSLGALGERYLGVPKSELGETLAKEHGGWDHIPVSDPRYAEYCRADLDLTRQLDAAIPYDPYEEREAAVSAITARASLSGMRVDLEGLQERAQSLADRSEEGRSLLADRYGFPLTNKSGKPSSAPQRTGEGKASFERALSDLGFPVEHWPRGKDGTLSLGKDVMARAAEWSRERLHPSLAVIEAVQTMNGIRNNAANVLRCVGSDGRVHPQFLPFQSTGRWSVQEPGLTVLKKGTEDSERAFLLPDKGDVLVSIDLDQVDIRCVAAHSQDPVLLDILNDPSRDIHQEVADLAGVPRKVAKTLDLGWLYGRTVNGLAQTPGMTRDMAAQVDASMREQFSTVMQWQRDVRTWGESGVLLDNGFGRRLRVDPERAFTQAPALMGQSTTRDLIAEGLLDLARKAPEVLPMLRVIVHDEVVASVPKGSAEEVARVIQSCMSREWAPAGKSWPVNVTAGQGKPFVFGDR